MLMLSSGGVIRGRVNIPGSPVTLDVVVNVLVVGLVVIDGVYVGTVIDIVDPLETSDELQDGEIVMVGVTAVVLLPGSPPETKIL